MGYIIHNPQDKINESNIQLLSLIQVLSSDAETCIRYQQADFMIFQDDLQRCWTEIGQLMFDRYKGNSLEKAIVFSTNGVGTNLDITMQKKEFDPIVENFVQF